MQLKILSILLVELSHSQFFYTPTDFDFHVTGVSSMSLDTHKYGYALKGTSVLLYANKELRQAQYFCYADWTGGLYTTPTLAGIYQMQCTVDIQYSITIHPNSAFNNMTHHTTTPHHTAQAVAQVV
jgi:glutamate/tyrosine decarboxylase-like PLP-dependent enzyme